MPYSLLINCEASFRRARTKIKAQRYAGLFSLQREKLARLTLRG